MSAQSIAILSLPVITSAAVTKFRAITAAGAHAATDLFGVAKMDAPTPACISVDVQGTTIIEAGAAIPLGTKYVIADAAGRAIVGGTVAVCLGKLCPGQSAAAAGDLVEVLLTLTV